MTFWQLGFKNFVDRKWNLCWKVWVSHTNFKWWFFILVLVRAQVPGSPVAWGCRIQRLHLCRLGKTTPNECPGYNIKQLNGETQVMLELWGMRSFSCLPSLSVPLWPGVVAPDSVLSMSQIELTFKLITNKWHTKLNGLKLNCLSFNRL